ncbi:FtsW/RodA/SpoVE family cell cycle protein [Aquirufa regiilacus]|uniref:Probable peptidoglycan glycosyltransferase FtsW n=1 Tax=Aquirufa regiilacus TaxID=3024868 RepID=A0ABU3TTB7_9BACT|nr:MULTISPECIES: FtsW/RodA/SpoVE family cell cycle protein [unclassified Aquirufa]MDT8887719.1 FtsW/RodA/SpoVE family cell cycle protein [Aquirufa sp. LEPPI-3A]MDU0809070.1 FtsW/RodA/SpoVE family cell cycle protein [Aquirufa sp. LEOWEIH-7C]
MESKITKYVKEYLVGDYQIWFIVLLLNIFGLLIQFSTKSRMTMSGPFEPLTSIVKTIAILLASFYLMSWISRQNYIKITRFSNIFLFLSWGLILFAYFFGESKGGASRWINLGFVSFMPSDMAKLCLTASLAKIFSTRQADQSQYNIATALVILILIGVTCFLIMLSNFSTSILIFMTSIVLMFFGRVPIKYISSIVGIVAFLAVMVVSLGIGQRAATVRSRIATFITRVSEQDKSKLKEMNKSDENYQINLSKYAISTGALIPKGPGNSQYRYLLSQAESDFIYAIILEEYGLFMGILIPLFFLWFMWRGSSVIRYSGKPLGGLLSAGLTFSIVIQAFINMLVAVGAGPVTGQPLPMISAGGTSLVFTAISIGLILSISRDKEMETKI